MTDSLKQFIKDLAEQRATMLAELDDLLSLALTASGSTDPTERLSLARQLVDHCYDVLGTTEPAEALAKELGWSEEDDERSL